MRWSLGQDLYIRLSLTSSEEVFKTSWSRPIYSSWPYVFETPSRRFQYVFKTSPICLAKTFSRRLQDVLKTPSRCLQDMFKTSYQDVFNTSSKRLQDLLQKSLQDIFQTSSRHLENVLQRYLQEVFKKYHQVKLFLLTHLREVFNTFLKHSFPKTVIYRGVCRGKTTSEKFIVSVQIFQER